MGEREHAAAWKAALSAALPGPASAFEFGDPEVAETVAVPDLPNVYAVLALSRRPVGPLRLAGGTPACGWRLTTRAVGRTRDQAQWVRDVIYAAVNWARPPIAGATPARLEEGGEERIAFSGGMFWGDTDWLYEADD